MTKRPQDDDVVIKPEKKVKFDTSKPKSPLQERKSKSFQKKSTVSNKDKEDAKKGPNASKAKNKPYPLTEKPEDWNEFKKKKKELKVKRKQSRSGFDVIVQAKQMGEKLRCKTLKGGDLERNKIINELHSLLRGKDHYSKFVLAHDTSRIVQWLLKYSSDIVKEQISKELIPVTLEMLQSKYGIFCAKRLLKYGSQSTKSAIVSQMYGNAVKLTSHVLSAPVFELAYTTCATPLQKQHLTQEFFGDLYKSSKDNKVKHLRDIFEMNPDLKAATLGATKANLLKIINKNLLDSALVHTVLNQFLSECTLEDRAEIISLIVPHIVVISNSKDGARAAMKCIWYGTNKDRKLAMKTLKPHVVELSKHENGHCTVITLLDTSDDTVLLHKVILSEILNGARDLAVDEWGRKVLLWLVAPGSSSSFHPVFVKELEEGRTASNSKKQPEIRQKEILQYSIDTLLGLVVEEPQFWLANSSLAHEMRIILNAGGGKLLKKAHDSIVGIITQPDWRVKVNDKEVLGIEDAGLHMVLKKLAQNDKDRNFGDDCKSFGKSVVEALSDETLKVWLALNRGCFFLITIYENSDSTVQQLLKDKLKTHSGLLKKQKNAGSKILLEKLLE